MDNLNIGKLNNKISDSSDEAQRWTSWINQILNVLVSGGMLTLVIYEIYNNDEKERLNPFNSNKEGREYSKLSGLFFTLLPLLTAKLLYHIYLMIVGPKSKQDDDDGKEGTEKGKFKALRHIMGLLILIAVAGCFGLIVHPSPDYCFNPTLSAADSKMYELHNLGVNETLVNGGRIDLKKHLKKCNVSDLVYKTINSKNETTSEDRYGDQGITNIHWLLVGAILLRVFGVFLDHHDPRDVFKWTDPDDINIIKFVILLGASLMSVLAVNIAKDEDLLEKDHTGKQLVEDWVFLDVFIGFAWAHFGLLGLGFLIQLLKSCKVFPEFLKVFLINNMPLVRALIVTGTIVAVAYTVGTAAILHIDYSFLSIALVSQVVLDVFGRDKKDAIA